MKDVGRNLPRVIHTSMAVVIVRVSALKSGYNGIWILTWTVLVVFIRRCQFGILRIIRQGVLDHFQ